MDNRTFEQLNRLNAVCDSAKDPYSMVELAVIEFRKIFSADSAWLLYPCELEASQCLIRFSATRPGCSEIFANQDVLPVTGGVADLFAELLSTNRPVVYSRDDDKGYFHRIAKRYGIKSQMAKVMRMRNQSPWVVGLHHYSRAGQWTEEDINLFHCAVDRLQDAFDAQILYETVKNDISKRQKVDAALSLSEQRFRALFHHSSISLCLCDYSHMKRTFQRLRGEGVDDLEEFMDEHIEFMNQISQTIKVIDLNQSMLDLFEVSAIKDFYLLWRKLSISNTHNAFKKMLLAFYAGHGHFSMETKFKSSGGNLIPAILTIDKLPSEKAGLILVSIIRISKQEFNEAASTVPADEKFRLLMENANDAIIVADSKTGRILEANRQAGQLTGRSPDALIGLPQTDIIVEQQLANHENRFGISFDKCKTNARYETSIPHVDGYHVPVEISVNLTAIGDKRLVQIIFHDISKRLELDERRRLLSTAIDQVDESVVITDIEGNIQYVNPAFERVSGYTFNEVAGKTPRVLNSGKMDEAHFRLLWREITSGNVWRGRLINKRKDGSIFEEEATITPVRDKHERIQHYVAVKRDITQQVVWENQIRQSQKMQAIGVLAGGIAHDFNNILTAIMGYAEVSLLRADDDDVLRQNLNEIVNASDRAGKLIDQILTFSRQTEKNVASLELRTIIKEVLKLLRASLPANIKIIQEIESDAAVKADPTQVHQIIMNLCTNAYQAIGPRGGWIRVNLKSLELGKHQGIELGNLNQGQYVRLRVEDNGGGIAPEFIDRIFDPYFTTKEQNEGNGLGLSVVHGIVNDHGGTVTVRSTPGKGSVFDVYLPRSSEEKEPRHPGEREELIRGRGTVLIVDDENQIVEYEMNVLESLGYETNCHTSSFNALEVFKENPDKFDLVITDMAMPDMTGLQLFAEIRKINQGVPVLICTGYSEHISAESSEELGINGYLAKPFTADQLAREVKKIIDAKSSPDLVNV